MKSTSQPGFSFLWKAVFWFAIALPLAGGIWCRWIYVQVERYSIIDQAAPSDAIVVFGAAEYDGRPSPVFRARLDHARILYERGIAPLIVTVGGRVMLLSLASPPIQPSSLKPTAAAPPSRRAGTP